MLNTSDPGVLAEYTDLLMLQQKLRGLSYQEIGLLYSLSKVAVEARIDAIGSECMRGAMEATRGDPAHPQKGLFKLEDFTADPRKCMEVIMERRLRTIEDRYEQKEATAGASNNRH